MRENILNIEDLSIWYRTYRGYSKVVDHINLQVGKGEKIGLVGESGCGKTTTMKTVMGVLGKDLIHVPDGKIDFAGKNVLEMKQSELLQLRRTGISMISQSPMSALNPVFTIGQQLTDIIKYSGLYKKNDKKAIGGSTSGTYQCYVVGSGSYYGKLSTSVIRRHEAARLYCISVGYTEGTLDCG